MGSVREERFVGDEEEDWRDDLGAGPGCFESIDELPAAKGLLYRECRSKP